MRVVATAALIVGLTVGCSDGNAYDRSDVTRAFRTQGFELDAPTPKLVSNGKAVLAPKTGEPFLVIVFKSEKPAADAARTLAAEATADSLDLRAKNVVVTSDEGLRVGERKRIRDALVRLASAYA
jgi:hypothetical protein